MDHRTAPSARTARRDHPARLGHLANTNGMLAALLCLLPAAAQAQGFCSSDGQPRPQVLTERFINADCLSCWSELPASAPPQGAVVLDWIVPGAQGDDAALSAAATRDAALRLQSLGLERPAATHQMQSKVVPHSQRTLRVAHGVSINGYSGASIEIRRWPAALLAKARAPATARWQAWLALVEVIPAGTEGTPVDRHLVRNLLVPDWGAQAKAGSAPPGLPLVDRRVMSVPDGANPDRLRVVGWVEDGRGRILAAAQSRCATEN